MIKSVSVKAFAKINLSIDVLERLENGYHRIETVMQQINLFDDIKIESTGIAGIYAGYKIKLNSTGKDLPDNPEENLAFKAAKLMAEMFCPLKDNKIIITLNKNIPTAAGLAGGSSDAAAVMLALCKLWNIEIGLKDLCEIGTKIGADVPFCIIGNAKNNPELGFADDELATSSALAEGIGDILTPVPSLMGWVVLVKPDISVATPFVYQKLSDYNALPGQGTEIERPDTKMLIQGLHTKNNKQIIKNMVNVLETVSLKEYPIVVYTKNNIDEICNPDKVLMSGSGPTVFAFFHEEDDAVNGYAKSMGAFTNGTDQRFSIHLAKLL